MENYLYLAVMGFGVTQVMIGNNRLHALYGISCHRSGNSLVHSSKENIPGYSWTTKLLIRQLKAVQGSFQGSESFPVKWGYTGAQPPKKPFGWSRVGATMPGCNEEGMGVNSILV